MTSQPSQTTAMARKGRRPAIQGQPASRPGATLGMDGLSLVCDLRDLPDRAQAAAATLIGSAKRRAIEHLTGDGPTVFEHVCRMGLEGIVSKRTDAPYRSGPSRTWLKSKNPASAAVRWEHEESVTKFT